LVLHSAFVADRERRLYADAESARRSLDQTIAKMEAWKNADECSEIIGKVRHEGAGK
jgi:hypothetical protein